MEATTLITFMLQESGAASVELFGSWDKFTTAWKMKRDTRRGPGHWTGCHKFRNIVCDGTSSGPQPERDGGLKMGGLYWYYYRLNGENDHYDPSQPSTNSCPLLPGQYVNILEVPWEKKFVSRSDSTSIAMITAMHTLNPDDRYRNPRPAPKPRLPKLMTKLQATDPRAMSAAPPDTASSDAPRLVKSATHAPINFFSHALDYVSAAGVRLRDDKDTLRPLPETSISKAQISYPVPIVIPDIVLAEQLIQLPKRPLRAQMLDEASASAHPLSHKRAVTAPDLRPVTQFLHRRAVSAETLSQSTSTSAQQHSIARKPVAKSNAVAIKSEVHDQIGPRPAPPLGLNLLNLDIDMQQSTVHSTALQTTMNLDKQLPALPSYLVPSPLFSSTHIPKQDTMQSRDLSAQQSRFSVWSMASDDEEWNLNAHSTTSSGSPSSLCSSTMDDSGYSSPVRLSELFWSTELEKYDFETTPLPQHKLILHTAEEAANADKEEIKPQLSAMEQLIQEFEYIGAALI